MCNNINADIISCIYSGQERDTPKKGCAWAQSGRFALRASGIAPRTPFFRKLALYG